MSQSTIHTELSAAEWKLIQELRALPESALRDRVQQTFAELIFFFRNPRCQGIGIEGFPCGEPNSSCEDCHYIWEALDKVAARAKKEQPEPGKCC
jgi:hypothetical protein